MISPRTGAAAAYVALSRGRHGNTAYVSTVQVPEDAPVGQASTVDRRDPVTVFADVIGREQDDQSALQVETESWKRRNSAQTAGDRLADAVEILSTGRTAVVLDRLTAAGLLTGEQRQRLAADPATGQLGRLLRQVELAGRDFEAELSAAVATRPLDGAESIAAVMQGRLSDRLGQLVPRGDTFADRLPAVEDMTWRRYLEAIAEIADQRVRELGAEVAQTPPRWAREGLGETPIEPVERLDWEQRAGRVAAYRELAGHEDEVSALGPAPKPGKVEHHAAWHSAWRALGRPEAGREEAGMSDGQLLVRIRGYQREEAWAPAYVADELDGTTREAVKHRQDAILLAARIAAASDADRPWLQEQAVEAGAFADILDERVRQLVDADDIRSRWYVHTAETRAAADRARAELADRGVDPDQPADVVSPQAWLAACQARTGDVDVQEADLADVQDQRGKAVREVEPIPVDAVETAVPDIREVAAAEPAAVDPADRGRGRVATAEETAAAVKRAQRALLELQARAAAERERIAEEARQMEQTRRSREQDVAARTAGAEMVDG